MALSSTTDFAAPSGAMTGASQTGPWRQVLRYYLLAQGIALAVWMTAGAQTAAILPGHLPVILVLLAQYSPAIAALFLIAKDEGVAGLGRFARTSLSLRFGARWYAAAFLTPPLMAIALIGLHALHGGYVPSLAGLRDVQSHIAQFWAGNIKGVAGGADNAIGRTLAGWCAAGLPQALLVFCGMALFNGGISEEAGWRGYALAKLLPGRRPLFAALIVGFFWGLWHTGPVFWADIFQGRWIGFSIPLEYTLATVPLTVMIAWLFVNARKSLLPGMILHACYNATFYFLTQIWTPAKPIVSIPEWIAATYVAAMIVIVIGWRTFLPAVKPATH